MSAGETNDHPAAAPDPDALEREVLEARAGLDRLTTELGRRGHSFFDVRRQVRRHPLTLVLTGLAVVAAIGGVTTLLVRHHRRRNHWLARARRWRREMAEALKSPSELRREPSATRKLGVAGGTAAASVLAKAVAERMVRAARKQGG